MAAIKLLLLRLPLPPSPLFTPTCKCGKLCKSIGDDGYCPPCEEKNSKRFRFKKFCRRQAVFRGTVVSQEVRGELVRLGVQVHDVWRNTGGVAQRYLPSHIRHNLAPMILVWVPFAKQQKIGSVMCVCPRFKLDQSYLFISQAYEIPYHDRSELLLDQKSTILPWSESWRRRLTRFAIRQERGKCDIMDESPIYSKARMSPGQHRRNALLNRSAVPTIPSQSLPPMEAQPRIPRHYYQQDSHYFPVNPVPQPMAPPSWNQHQYRSMRHAELPPPSQNPLLHSK
ncbi:hypothetical protein ACTXT7_002407 [Hymenolepis weldensis]